MKKTINIPGDNLDMFTKHGVKTIVAGNTKYNIVKPRRKRCDHCGQLKPKEQVSYVVNSYEEDVEGRIIMENLCDDCYQNLLDDI